MILDTAGILGLGAAPSAWGSGSRALQINSNLSLWSASATNNYIYANAYYDGTDDKYVSTAEAARLRFAGATTIFNYAASGSANANITWLESFRTDASGNLSVGKATADETQASGNGFGLNIGGGSGSYFSIVQTSSSTGNACIYLNRYNSSGSMQVFQYNNTTVGSISHTSSVTLYNTTSDQRLKENIQDANSASSLIDSLQVRKFDWKKDSLHQRYGFVAQELVAVAPEAVYQPTDPEEMMAVDYSKLVPMLVKELQSLRARVAQLESKP